MTTSETMTRPDYGIDAPGLVRNLFLGGSGALLLLLPAAFGFWPSRSWGVLLAALLLVCAAYLLGMACLLLYASRVSKLRGREYFDRSPFSQRARADSRRWLWTRLDAGRSRQAARDGKAVGIDIWQAGDQADNRPTPPSTMAVWRALPSISRLRLPTCAGCLSQTSLSMPSSRIGQSTTFTTPKGGRRRSPRCTAS